MNYDAFKTPISLSSTQKLVTSSPTISISPIINSVVTYHPLQSIITPKAIPITLVKMPRDLMKSCLRIIETEVRELLTRRPASGETDPQALSQIHTLISSEPSSKKRQDLKDIYALIIWNIVPGSAYPIWKHDGLQNEFHSAALNAESLEALSRIEAQLKTLPTFRDIKRSKWTYICLIREMEPLRMFHSIDSGIGRILSATSSRKNSEKNEDSNGDESREPTRIQAQSRKTEAASVYVVAARHQLAIRALEGRLAGYEAKMAEYEEQVSEMRAMLEQLQDHLIPNDRGRAVVRRRNWGSESEEFRTSCGGQFVFFDAN